MDQIQPDQEECKHVQCPIGDDPVHSANSSFSLSSVFSDRPLETEISEYMDAYNDE